MCEKKEDNSLEIENILMCFTPQEWSLIKSALVMSAKVWENIATDSVQSNVSRSLARNTAQQYRELNRKF